MKKVKATNLPDKKLIDSVVFVDNTHHNHKPQKKKLLNESGVVHRVDGDQCLVFFRNDSNFWFNKKRLKSIQFDKSNKLNNLKDAPKGIYLQTSNGGYPKFIRFSPDKRDSQVYHWYEDKVSGHYTDSLVQLSNEKERTYYRLKGSVSVWKMIVNQDFSN